MNHDFLKTPSRLLALLSTGTLFLAGCNNEKISVYSVPKEEPSSAQNEPAAKAESSGAEDATWTAPQGWKPQPASQMLLAMFLVEGGNGQKADVSVSAFPGSTGGDLANVNRWRGQIKLPPIAEAELAGALQKMDTDGRQFLVAEMEKDGRAILGAILHREDKTWFFKMIGDSPLVAAQKELFVEFLKSVRFGSASVAEPAAPVAAAPVAPATPAVVPPVAPPPASEANSGDKPKWKVPSGWQEQPAGGMRAGSFSIAEDDRKADVSVIVLGGAAGGPLANINRWRGQLHLPPISEADVAKQAEKVEAAGSQALVVDIVGESPTIDGKYKARMLGAIIERGPQTWFVKINGEDALVEKQKPAFLEFLKSIQLPGQP